MQARVERGGEPGCRARVAAPSSVAHHIARTLAKVSREGIYMEHLYGESSRRDAAKGFFSQMT